MGWKDFGVHETSAQGTDRRTTWSSDESIRALTVRGRWRYKHVIIDTFDIQSNRAAVRAIEAIGEQIKRDTQLTKLARPEFVRGSRAFVTPLLRAIGGIAVISLIVLAEIGRQQQSSQ